MNTAFSPKLRKGLFIGIAVLAALMIIVKLLSMRTHDPKNPRSLPNGYLMTYTVPVSKDPHTIFNFITYHMAEHNLSIAEAHDRFEIINELDSGLTLGAKFIAEEFQDDEGVKNTYVVKEVVPDKLIYYASEPSLIYRKKKDQWVQEGKCNAYVYFDLVPQGENTLLTQTIVIEMPNFFIKFITDIIASMQEENEWQMHLEEELDGLKKAIENYPI